LTTRSRKLLLTVLGAALLVAFVVVSRTVKSRNDTERMRRQIIESERAQSEARLADAKAQSQAELFEQQDGGWLCDRHPCNKYDMVRHAPTDPKNAGEERNR